MKVFSEFFPRWNPLSPSLKLIRNISLVECKFRKQNNGWRYTLYWWSSKILAGTKPASQTNGCKRVLKYILGIDHTW